MKDYEEKVLNIMDSAKDNIKSQLDKAYKSGYEDAKSELGKNVIDLSHEERDRAYQRGLNEAWEVAKKIAQMDTETSENITGYFGLFRIMDNLTAAEAIEKVKAYEQKQDAEQEQQDRIRVGDEVITEFGYRGIVITDVPCKEGNISVWSPTCTHVQMYPVKKLTKTGRHFDQIAEVLEKMRGE